MLVALVFSASAAPDWVDDPLAPLPPSAVSFGEGEARVLVRAPVEALENRGITVVARPDGHVPRQQGWVGVDGSREAIAALHAEGFEVRPDRWIDLGPAPNVVTDGLTQAHSVKVAQANLGEGIGIANIDTHIDLYHPHFFFADAGVFDWVDVDGDGVLTPGVDGVDGDGDGLISPAETLEEFDGNTFHIDPNTGSGVLQSTQGLDPRRDWLFLDSDGNNQRTMGRPGWTDDDPGLGEPTFVPDDVNGNGVMDVGERLWQLGTPVVRSVYWDLSPYRRGQDLTFYMEESGNVDRSHGTLSSGLMVGGQLPHQRDLHGVLPMSELVFVSRQAVGTTVSLLSLTDYVADRDVDVVLHEYSPWMGWSMDGSSLLESLVDDLAHQGMVQVCPVGNLAEAGKHTRLMGEGQFGTEITLPQSLPWLFVEWHYDGDTPVQCELSGPDDFRMKRTEAGYEPNSGMDTWLAHELSPGGRGRSSYVVFGDTRDLPAGSWRLECEGPGSQLDVYLLDFGQWNRLATFETEEMAGTMGVPSTALGCIAVGAARGQFVGDGEVAGEALPFSGRGPALGGQKSVDLLAPQDAFGPDTERAYSAFAGTSGAAPHVAAAAALVLAENPELNGLEVKALLESGADASVLSGSAPDDHGGWGGLATADALFGDAAVLVQPLEPSPLGLQVSEAEGCVFEVSGVHATYDVDLDYDGLIEGSRVEFIELEPGQRARIDAFDLDGQRVGGEVVAAPAQCAPVDEEPSGCGCGTTHPPGWLSLLPLLLWRRASPKLGSRGP